MMRGELESIFEKYGPMVFRRAKAILGNEDEAKDATQEVFIRAFLNAERFEHRSHVTTWLYRITTNVCLNWIRDAKRRRELNEEHFGDRENAAMPINDRFVLARKLLAEAEEEWALAAIYVHVDGMSHAEAAKLLGVSRRTIGNLLLRFERFAKSYLSKQGEEFDPVLTPTPTFFWSQS
jgi:RNA polymerase sigma-70 factor (ECF subfamily)